MLGKRSSVAAELDANQREATRTWDASNTPTFSFDHYRLPSDSVEHDDSPNGGQDMDWTGGFIFREHTGICRASTPSLINEDICYGALCDAKVKFTQAQPSALSTNAWIQFCQLEVYKNCTYHSVRLRGGSDEIGILDLVTTDVLRTLQEWPEIKMTAVISVRDLTALSKKKVRNAIASNVSVNIMGPKELLETVGDAVTERQGYLQHPYYLPDKMEYFNPHYFYPGRVKVNLRHLIGPPLETLEAARFAQGLQDVFSSLAEVNYSDTTILDLLEAAYRQGMITTTLKKHQVDGVNFIYAREDRGIAASMNRTLQGVIGYQALASSTRPILGGINADSMGLGKTLTMLSAILCSMREATEFGRLESNQLLPTRATLIVAPSPQVMEVWKYEVMTHFKAGALLLCTFHGDNRATTAEELIENDVVLTTYHTLVSDQKGRKLLQRVMWFRIVLDEAHWIRNNTTQQFKAACSLTAERRWCLSGTPIQNSLNDLRSLLEFLHFQPFSELGSFRKFIIEPLQVDSPNRFRNLKLLMRVVCFRRTSDLLSLPQPITQEVPIELTSDEQQLYQDILSVSEKEYQEIIKMRSTRKKYCVIFAALMKLRRLCNHGTFQISNPTHEPLLTPKSQVKKGTGEKNETEDERLCAYCDGEDTDINALEFEECPECSRVLLEGGFSSRSISANPAATSDTAAKSPRWTQDEQIYPITCTRSPLIVGSEFSSKLKAVVDNIETSPDFSKHLIFTSWRHTLDILQLQLRQRNLPCLRIDGQTSFSDRQSILALFHQHPAQKILLLSIATGAVGLTLTVADHVHIVEPQWNPLVEEQAIGRALRIGQERSLTIYKYIVINTVEQNIVTLQKKKNQLAKISLDGCVGDQAQQGLEDLMFIMQT